MFSIAEISRYMVIFNSPDFFKFFTTKIFHFTVKNGSLKFSQHYLFLYLKSMCKLYSISAVTLYV